MSAYTVLRIAKLKSLGSIAGTDKHNARERDTPNADKNREADNRVVMGAPETSAHDSIKSILSGQRIRSNAVFAVEMLLSASSEYFRPNAPEAAGTYDKERLEAWVQASTKWLQERYGDRIQKVTLHCDEATPHLHAVLVPLDDRGKLNCRQLFGGTRQTLRDLQSDYAKAVKSLGIERGIGGSQGKHQKVAQFYALTQSNKKAILPAPEKYDQPQLPGKLARMADDSLIQLSRKAATSGAQAQKEVLEPIMTALKKDNMLLRQQVVSVKRANSRLSQENVELRKRLDKMRALDLDKVLLSMFKAKGPYRAQEEGESRFCLPDKREVVVSGVRWKVDNAKQGKGAIDLVMALKGYSQDSMKKAVAELAIVFGEDKAIGECVAQVSAQAQTTVRMALFQHKTDLAQRGTKEKTGMTR